MNIFHGSKHTYFVVVIVNFIGLLCGTGLSWSSPEIPKLQNDNIEEIPLGRKITDDEESWIGSLTALGGVFAPFLYAFLVQLVGRKLSILGAALPFLIAYAIAAFAKTVWLFYLARILMGFGIGGAFTVLPIYVVEVAEDKNRGTLASVTTSFIYVGSLFTNALGPYVSIQNFNIILSVMIIIYIPVFLYFIPETPYFLAKRKQDEKALKSLYVLRRRNESKLEKELQSIKTNLDEFKPGSFKDIFRTKANRKAFLFSIIMTNLQQFSGIVVVMFYTQSIFAASKADLSPDVSAIIVSAVQVSTCFLTPTLTDRLGRKPLLLIAVNGAILSETILGVYFYFQDKDIGLGWLPIVGLVGFIISYNFGLGSLPWGIMSEILPLNLIQIGSSWTTSLYWLTGFLLTKFFPSISKSLGMAASFWFFAGFCVVFELFVIFFLFETKGKSLKEIQDILGS